MNGDEDVSDEDEEMEFEPDTSNDCSESSDEHLIFDEDDMDVDNVSHNDDRNANVITSNVTGSVWKRYDSTDSDLQRFSFNASNPGIRLPSCGQYNEEINFFQLFFSDDIFREFVHETNRYAREKIEKLLRLRKRSIWRSWIDARLEEMKAFLGIVINMGINGKCDIKEYFSVKWLARMPFFLDVFSRERFCQIYWMLHIQQSVGQGLRGDKVQSLADHINLKCREYFVPYGHIAVDESTIGFKGRVSWKCYNLNKPTKWGVRVYNMCDNASGYIVAFVSY